TRLEKTHGDEKQDPSSNLRDQVKKSLTENSDEMQLSFFNLDDPILEDIRDDISNVDINTLTPVEALMKLNEIKKKLG
ncbi:MAG: hypothetical protein ACPGVD_12745, partial [Flavobacteriales bacterium]